MSEQVIIDGELNLDSAFDGLPNEQIIVNVTGAPKIIDKASGKIASIVDGAENERLLSAIVNIEPVQDLHGYDYPWPAGGGKNQMTPASAQTKTANGVTIRTNGDGIYRFSGTATALTEINFDVPEFRTPISIGQGGNGGLFIMNSFASANSGVVFMYNSTVVDSWTLSEVNRSNTAYAVIGDKLINKITFRIASGLNVDNATISPMFSNDGSTSVLSFSPYSNVCPISGRTQVNVWVKPTYDTSLTPTATIPLGQTVCGGTLDVLAGEGESQLVSKTYSGAASENWRYSSGRFNILLSDAPDDSIGRMEVLCNIGKYASAGATVGTIFLYGKYLYYYAPSNITTVADFKTWLASNNLQVVYPLATPQEYDVSPKIIKTLLGINNVWADAGSIEIEYVADTKLYIQRLTAPTEDDMIANENIASGKFFMIGNDLYLSTAAIVAGETIAPGTNCTKLSLAEALNNINA